MECMALCNDV
jgi:magnesium-transporting ATPase (P-type)